MPTFLPPLHIGKLDPGRWPIVRRWNFTVALFLHLEWSFLRIEMWEN